MASDTTSYAEALRDCAPEDRLPACFEDGSLFDALVEEAVRYRRALEAIANAEIPGVSGGPHGASAEVAEFAREALR